MKLVENWRDAYKWLSVHCMVVAGAIQGAWVYIPDDMKMHVHPHLINGMTAALMILGIVGRLKKQAKPDE